MLNWIIDWVLHHRGLVLSLAVALVVAAGILVGHLNIDAFPDTTPVQVQVNTTAPALGPEEVERQITLPIEQVLGGLPDLLNVRSISKAGLSQVVATFADHVDVYFARRLVSERLDTVPLPAEIGRPELGPVSSGLGEVFHYVVTSPTRDLTELRTLQDWVIAPALRTVPGVAEVNSWGGYKKQYEVRIDPARLISYGLTFDEVTDAIRANNLNAGGGSLSAAGGMLLVQGLGRVATLDHIGGIVIRATDGVPVCVRDVAEVAVGHELRHGAVTYSGNGEAVLGLGFTLIGQNTHEVTARLKTRLDEIKDHLPPEVRAEVVYDRTELVDHVLETVRNNLFEGGLLVVAVLFLFLGNLRAGLIVALAIPLSLLFAFSGMLRFGIAASLMSLGALDFGLVVDSAVIQVENATRHLSHRRGDGDRLAVVRDAVLEVRKPTLFGELIIVLVYVPILVLEGIEGRLFKPMALTVIFALTGSLLLSLTVMPALASLVLPRTLREREPLLVQAARWAYRPILRGVMRFRWTMIGLALAGLGATALVARGLGSEFIPRLSEEALVVTVARLAGTDLSESIRYNTQMEKALLAAFPHEVRHVWSRIGTAEVATDPMGVELSDVFIALHPRARWQRCRTQTELAALIHRELRDLPGQRIALSQPVEMRLNEMIAGARGDVVAKLYGDDFDVLVQKANEVAAVLGSIEGAADLTIEQLIGLPVLQVRVNRAALARYGIPARVVMGVIEAIGGTPLGDVIEGQLRFPLVARLPEQARRDPTALAGLMVAGPAGEHVSLGQLAAFEQVEGPATITREWGQRRLPIQVNVRGRDMGSFVAEAQRRVAERVELPPGRYRLEWGGQFEHLERARTRLMLVVPLVLLTIFGLLYVTYHRLADALRVFLGVPFAVVGGVFALWVRGMPFSISAAVGFIALSGVAVLGEMVLVSSIRQGRDRGLGLAEAVEAAALARLRPVLMTALVAALGFVPMALSTGVGAEVQRPLATVVIGGVFTSTLLTLLVLPAVYVAFARRAELTAPTTVPAAPRRQMAELVCPGQAAPVPVEWTPAGRTSVVGNLAENKS
ncbi:MAG TPA: CusA/CzcA family heavy metal efflux RND transporter [Phycisphaerae bacterium]|nr:CusA/CzcA family heavy metal efflux RND transporter [Phycisphaerae bacterium]HNU45391.1 CusA/CzcA family heavy metal efflux RND transporter [Phycisphaerae bacterium]